MLLSTRAERLKIWADFPHFFSDHPLVTMRLSPTWLYAPHCLQLAGRMYRGRTARAHAMTVASLLFNYMHGLSKVKESETTPCDELPRSPIISV